MKIQINKKVIKIFLYFVVCFSIIGLDFYLSDKRQKEKEDLYNRTEFYRLMYRKNDFDFIKTAEKELENIEYYVERFSDDEGFRGFINYQKNGLSREIENKKLDAYSKKGKIKAKPKEYGTFEQLYPDLVIKFKDEGKVLEYKKLDYIEYYKDFCFWFHKEDAFKEFLYKYKLYNYSLASNTKMFGIGRINSITKRKIKKWSESTRKELSIQDGIQDVFWNDYGIGTFSTKNNNGDLICSLQFNRGENTVFSTYKTPGLDNIEELNECSFERKNDLEGSPYYCFLTDEYVYLIYSGYVNTDYNSQDFYHLKEKKYMFAQCEKEFFENFGIYSLIENNNFVELLYFYQKDK